MIYTVNKLKCNLQKPEIYGSLVFVGYSWYYLEHVAVRYLK